MCMAYTIERRANTATITADGLKEKDAFLDSARGLFASMYELEKVRGTNERIKVIVEGKSLGDLLKGWLQELLERRIIHSVIYSSFSIVSIQKISNTQFLLTGSAHGEAFDSSKHPALINPTLQLKSISCKEKDKKFSCAFQIKTAQ